ncbi:uncharacterized protein ATC70_000637 [Mucor velutinosus]|uniref:Uncharacterized protein n=1 Tax=Mucor velutinosus TaxID=708070 RepID=A0AAN7DIC9_9FUNG|nr:hypothetical protein ATC70_000637 [Mucor velutinosus]
MKSSQLVTRSGNIQLKKAHGFQTQDILPAGYNMKTDVTTFAPPLPSNALKSTAFCNGVKDLFQSRHIDYLHTALFGQRGTKISHPTFAALSSANAPILDAIARDTPQPASELMMVARGLSLKKLLEILLRVHLAPKRESHYWELQQTKAKKQSKQDVKSVRNSFHNAIRSEKYKLQRYQRKAQGKPEDNNWAKLARNSQERITHMYVDAKHPVKSVSTSGTTSDQATVSASGSGSFTTGVSIPTAPSGTSDAVTASNASFDLDSADMPIDELLPLSELIDEKDEQEEEEGTRDLLRRRIMILKATPRNLLARQAGKSITHTQLKKERPDITEEENCLHWLPAAILPGLTSVRILGTKPSSNKSASNAKKPLDIDWDTVNPACVSVLNHRAIQGRDKTSALAIAVSGLPILLFKQPLPVFNPKPSQSNTGIISKTTSFRNRNEKRDDSGAALADA